jgi:TPR repeat protein
MVSLWLLIALLAPTPGPSLPPGPTPAEFVFDNNVRRSADLPTYALQALRKSMVAGKDIGGSGLQQLADAGDGLAAFRFAQQLEATPDSKPAVIAHYYAIAAYTGRSFAVSSLVRMLKAHGASFPPATLQQALDALTVQAKSGHVGAGAALGQMYVTGEPFGHDLEKAQMYLALMPEGKNPKAALRLGITLLSDPEDKAQGHPAARAALAKAAAGSDLGTSLTATTLLGQLDTPVAQAPPMPKATP